MTLGSRLRRSAAAASLLVVLALVAAACGRDEKGSGSSLPPDPPASVSKIGPYPRSQFYIQRDLVLAADVPAVVPAGEASFLTDDAEVFGLVVKGKARAYAVTMLSYHHVVNDVIEGIPVAVTY